MKTNLRIACGVVLSSLWMWGCATLSPTFDQAALDQAVKAKADAAALMSRAGEPYPQHEAAANALKAATFDRKSLGARGLGYERLDQLTLEVLLGIR